MHKKIQRLNVPGNMYVPIMFVCLSIVGLLASGLSVGFVANEVVNRFVRNGVMLLALIIPIKAGLGINFSVTVGAMCAQIAYLTVIAAQITELQVGAVLLISLVTSVFAGSVIGHILNRVQGKEMITTIIIGFLANSMYQLLFMVCAGWFIPVKNTEILLSRGIGIRNLVDLKDFRGALDQILAFDLMGVHIPVFMIALILVVSAGVKYLLRTPLGQEIRSVGMDFEKSGMVGIDGKKIRVFAIVISTVLAALGHLIYLQNIGMLNVYTGHLKHEIFASAALLAGGATVSDAEVRHAFIGLVLFHTLFIVSPQAGQNLFNNPALGEYFRSFIAYGTIAFALIMNLKEHNDQVNLGGFDFARNKILLFKSDGDAMPFDKVHK